MKIEKIPPLEVTTETLAIAEVLGAFGYQPVQILTREELEAMYPGVKIPDES